MWRSEARAAGRFSRRGARLAVWLAVTGFLLLAAGCAATMKQQPKYLPLEFTEFYPDNQSARVPPTATIARGLVISDTLLTTGKVNGQPVNEFPFQMSKEDLQRGQSLFNGICAECHDRVGTGQGVVVQRGFSAPLTYHSDQVRNMPVGQMFDIVTNGFGAMPAYGPILQVPDRWRVIAYIRVLQLSQNAKLSDVPPDMQGNIKPGGQ
jgi:mono/diheme cytochrome c family protein